MTETKVLSTAPVTESSPPPPRPMGAACSSCCGAIATIDAKATPLFTPHELAVVKASPNSCKPRKQKTANEIYASLSVGRSVGREEEFGDHRLFWKNVFLGGRHTLQQLKQQVMKLQLARYLDSCFRQSSEAIGHQTHILRSGAVEKQGVSRTFEVAAVVAVNVVRGKHSEYDIQKSRGQNEHVGLGGRRSVCRPPIPSSCQRRFASNTAPQEQLDRPLFVSTRKIKGA